MTGTVDRDPHHKSTRPTETQQGARHGGKGSGPTAPIVGKPQPRADDQSGPCALSTMRKQRHPSRETSSGGRCSFVTGPSGFCRHHQGRLRSVGESGSADRSLVPTPAADGFCGACLACVPAAGPARPITYRKMPPTGSSGFRGIGVYVERALRSSTGIGARPVTLCCRFDMPSAANTLDPPECGFRPPGSRVTL